MTQQKTLCKYAKILNTFDDDTQLLISERLMLSVEHPRKLSYRILVATLRSEGHSLGMTVVKDHYRGVCGCR